MGQTNPVCCRSLGLPESLQEMARIRLERPEATLKELGEALEPPVGKSGVNHRLRKLSLVAEELRQEATCNRIHQVCNSFIKYESVRAPEWQSGCGQIGT